MNEKTILERATKIIREVAPKIPLTDRRIYCLPTIPGMVKDWFVWVAFATVEPHTDRSVMDPHWRTRGLIIINDQNLELYIHEYPPTFWKFGPGDAYRVVPHIQHGVCTPEHSFNHKIPAEYNEKIFAALIRDYPVHLDPSYEGFKEQALAALEQWCDLVETTNHTFVF